MPIVPLILLTAACVMAAAANRPPPDPMAANAKGMAAIEVTAR
jgi:hypothetical protein